MRPPLLSKLLALSLVGSALTAHSAESEKTYDLVVYGGSSAGIAAAVQVKRMGGSVIIVEPGNRIGGLTTGGLGQTDIGNKHVIGGIAREFYQQVRQWYQKPENWKWERMPESGKFVGTGQSKTSADEDTLWTFEPSAALKIYQRWVKENDIPVVFGERLNRKGEAKAVNRGDGYHVTKPGSVAEGVKMENGRITAIIMESGKRYSGKMFMDATYEGDLLASAGVSYTVGREGEAIFGESLNGVQYKMARHHQFVDGVDPYVKKGDATSGLLPWIESTPLLEQGASDHRIQAYCFRMCLTDVDENRIPFEKPEGYDELWYELMFRNFEAGERGMPWINSLMPNRKTDTNNRAGFSTDFIGQNYDWPEASYDERKEIRAKHLQYQKGLMWSLANHPRVPEEIRSIYAKWGMSKDEFTEGNGWQEQLYVREGRRMISDVVMTQLHCQREEIATDSIGMGAYNMDSHHVQRHINEAGHVKNEGDVQVGVKPYPISYRSIIPKKAECSNLVVSIALSSSHIAFGSIRMEPVFMILGQSGATAAMHAIEQNVALQDVDYDKLKTKLLADKLVLDYEVPSKHVKLDTLKGIVVDESKASVDGHFKNGALPIGVHRGYLFTDPADAGISTATFDIAADKAGTYAVQMASLPNPNRSTKTLVRVKSPKGQEEVRVNQKAKPPVDDLWIPLQEVQLEAGEKVTVTISNEGANGFVIVDAVRLLAK